MQKSDYENFIETNAQTIIEDYKNMPILEKQYAKEKLKNIKLKFIAEPNLDFGTNYDFLSAKQYYAAALLSINNTLTKAHGVIIESNEVKKLNDSEKLLFGHIIGKGEKIDDFFVCKITPSYFIINKSGKLLALIDRIEPGKEEAMPVYMQSGETNFDDSGVVCEIIHKRPNATYNFHIGKFVKLQSNEKPSKLY